MKTCLECKNCLTVDYGYSNWTVEGTAVHCMSNVHQDTPFDRRYGADNRLGFADTCASFDRGVHEDLDVDHDKYNSLSYRAKLFVDNMQP
jgi:hypothetical protein